MNLEYENYILNNITSLSKFLTMLSASSLRQLNETNARRGSTDSSSDLDEGDNHLSGYLFKQSDHLKQWNIRFFVATGSDHIKYYKKEQDTAPKGFFSVSGCTFTELANTFNVKGKGLYVFEVTHPLSKNVLRLGSHNADVTKMWVETLRRVASGGHSSDVKSDRETARRLARAMNSIGTYDEAPSALREMNRHRNRDDDGDRDVHDREGDGEADVVETSSARSGHDTTITAPRIPTPTIMAEQHDYTKEDQTSEENGNNINVGGGSGVGSQLDQLRAHGKQAAGDDTPSIIHSSSVDTNSKRQRGTSLVLPTQNPLVHAGLNTRMAVAIVLVPLIGQFLGRSVLPWYIGSDEDTAERTINVLGNLCFVLGVMLSFIVVLLSRKR